MRILEVEQDAGADPKALLGLVNFLVGRAEDTNSSKQISQDAFIKMSQSLGINITSQTLGMLIADVPAVFIGDKLAERIPMVLVHRIAAAIFAVLGLATLLGASQDLLSH